jgi:opacity protein-like surface antigen
MLAAPVSVLSQRAYILGDSSAHYGLKILEGTRRDNYQFIKVKDREEGVVTTYYPNDISEYGLKDGTTYVSRTITINGEERKVFLNRLALGTLTLYHYNSKSHQAYYLETPDARLIELPRDGDRNYKDILSEHLSVCPYSKDNVRLVRYRDSSMGRLVSYDNKCTAKPFPYRKFGIVAGYGITSLLTPSNYNGPFEGSEKVDNYKGGLFGFSFDQPIYASHYSVHAELLVSRSSYSYGRLKNDRHTDMVVNLTSLDIPLQARYTFTSSKTRPFINAGGILSYRLQNSSALYNSTVTATETIVNDVIDDLVSDWGGGFAGGAGMQFNVSFRSTFSIELRYSKVYSGTQYLNTQLVGLLAGFTF